MFKIEVLGNLGADAEIKNDNGRQYVQFSVADTRKFTKDDGTTTEVTNWFSCFLRNVDSQVIPYLKKGVKVFVRGNGEMRLFSSAKDKMMKAGASVNVSEIELAGGSSDAVPRELALPSGQLVPVTKHYWVGLNGVDPRPSELYDRHGVAYSVDCNGFITAAKQTQEQQETQEGEEEKPF